MAAAVAAASGGAAGRGARAAAAAAAAAAATGRPRRRQGQRRQRQRGVVGARTAAMVAVVVAAAALFVAATPSEAVLGIGGGGGVGASLWRVAGTAGAAAAAAGATTAAQPQSGARSLQQQAAAAAAAAATPLTDADALAASVAAAAAAIDPPLPGDATTAAATPAADADGDGDAEAAAAERAALQTFTNGLATAGAAASTAGQQQTGGLDAPEPADAGEEDDDVDESAASAAASLQGTTTTAAGAGAAPASSGPALRAVEGAAASCSPQVGNGGSLLVAAPDVNAGGGGMTNPPRCRVMTQVCADHDALVLYSPRHNPRHPSFRAAAPGLELPGVRADYHSCDGAWGTAFDYPPPLVRPATPGEESADLSSPAFSRCTVPLALFPSSLYELGDFFRNTVATVRGLQRAGLLDRRMTPAVATLGMRLEAWHGFLLRPFFARPATTLSHLSSRLPRETPEPYSPDGTHVRCFSQLVACPTPRFWAPVASAAAAAAAASTAAAAAAAAGRGLLATAAAAAPARAVADQPPKKDAPQPPLWATAQDILEHYRPDLPIDGGIPPPGPGAPAENPLYPSGLRDPSKLRVIVAARRSRAARARLLNQEQVWSWCTKFAPPPGVGSSWNGTACALHEFGRDLPRDLALASRADVVIAVHGPDLYLGGLFLPRRSSVIEIRPYGFNATSDARADAYFRAPLRAEADALFWWGVDVEDENASRPGQRELERRGDPMAWPRDRHVSMRLVPLQYLMERVALTRRDLDKYRGFRARRMNHVSDGAPPRNLGLLE